MASEFIRAFIMIFMAEMGDKSQILAMTFSTKYKVKKVFIGLFIGILLNHILAVFIGTQLSQFFPIELITFIAGILFILFGLYSLRLDTNESVEIKETRFGPIITIAILFFIGELGDKTQLAAITLSSDAQYPLIILAGTVIGMMFTSMFGIFIGIKFGRKIPVLYMKVLSSVVFILFGVIKVLDNTMNFSSIVVQLIIATSIIFYIVLIILFFITHRKNNSLYIRTAVNLRIAYQVLSIKLDDICLGTQHCGVCSGNKCLIGYTKNIVKDVLAEKEVSLEYIESKIVKDYNPSKIREALTIIIDVLKNDFSNPKYATLHNVRNNFETILYGSSVNAETYAEYKEILETKDHAMNKSIIS